MLLKREVMVTHTLRTQSHSFIDALSVDMSLQVL